MESVCDGAEALVQHDNGARDNSTMVRKILHFPEERL
jgi:hypothetical protein